MLPVLPGAGARGCGTIAAVSTSSAAPDDAAADTSASAAPGPWTRFRHWPKVGRWAAYAVIVLVLLVIAGSVAGVVVVRKSFPQTSGRIAVPGLGSEATVVRDDHGIPQVYADNADDLFYAQGYTQAQDRFFEMDVRRHTTAGRLSELFGRDTLKTDMYIRTMGWRQVAEK